MPHKPIKFSDPLKHRTVYSKAKLYMNATKKITDLAVLEIVIDGIIRSDVRTAEPEKREHINSLLHFNQGKESALWRLKRDRAILNLILKRSKGKGNEAAVKKVLVPLRNKLTVLIQKVSAVK